jgi:hypothetical protein
MGPPMRSHILAFLALSTAALLACGGAQSPANQPSTEVGDAAAPTETVAEAGAPSASHDADKAPSAAGAEKAEPSFDDLPKDKKIEVMSTKVVPNVGKLFKEHDGKKFAKFTCATCHGTKNEDPQKVLPKLTLSNGGYEKLAKAKPAMMKFMGEQVVPAMAAALNEKPYDPATKQGFGCAGCHAVD